MVLVEINQKICIKENPRMGPAAAGLLLNPLPIPPFPHSPIFINLLNTQKTRIHISCVNHI